jgi:RNA polymerase sigma-70 factor (ECF subfamily)
MTAATLAGMTAGSVEVEAPHAERPLDPESRRWLERLSATGAVREEALGELHALLLKAARFEVARRSAGLAHVRRSDVDDVALHAAGDALVAILRRLGDFEGRSLFTTWAYKFALLEAAVQMRKLAWQGRELPLEPDALERAAGMAPAGEERELLDATLACLAELTPRQRDVLVALAVDGVPIDVLADRLGSTRGALYKTLHDARRALRSRLADRGYRLDDEGGGGGG